LNNSKRVVQRFLELRKTLIPTNLKYNSGSRATRKYTDLMDQFIHSLFVDAGFRDKLRTARKDCMAVVALGSYGRRELCLGSDVDLLVIHQGKLSEDMAGVISRAIYPLWDAKLDVGQSILTVQECIRLAMNDFRVLTSIVDARLLLGSRSFFNLFEVAFWSRIDREKEAVLNQFLINQKKREERYGSEGYFVEPDIKEGLGGLRDLHFMAWMSRIFFKCKRLSQIRRFAVFSHFGSDKLSHSNGFLLKVRNHLHLIAGRKEDRLLLPYQKELSHILGYEDSPYITGPEKFMRDLYLHINRIRYGHEEFQAKALDIINPLPLEINTPYHLLSEFRVIKNNIILKEGRVSEKDPLVILRAFSEANRLGLFLGSGFIWEARKKIAKEGMKFVDSPGARRLFLDLILKPTNPRIIRLALEVGLVGLFIPEFKRIKNLVEFGFYHVETVDLHTLRTLEVINEISKGVYNARWPIFGEVFKELSHPDWLFLTGLLHDIGKGYKEDHSEKGAELIPHILKNLGIWGKALEAIPFLVKHHLLLVRISQRRDLGDERTSVDVAQIVRKKDTLRMLFLLTIADSLSTGPLARTDWKIMLLIELFFKVRRILERGVLATPDATKKIEDQKKTVLYILKPDFPEKDILDIMVQASSRYFLSANYEDIVQHIRMALTLGERKHLWIVNKLKDAPVTRVIQCIYDKPGLFSKMVAAFTLNNINVLSANIFTLKNGLAFDIYEVTNPLDPYREEEMWKKVYNEINQALEDQIPLDELIEKKRRTMRISPGYLRSGTRRVLINNEVSDFFTVIEVSTDAHLGLLYNLAKEFFSLGLDIKFAKVNSDEERMTGVFYVRDTGGEKISEKDQIEGIKQRIVSIP